MPPVCATVAPMKRLWMVLLAACGGAANQEATSPEAPPPEEAPATLDTSLCAGFDGMSPITLDGEQAAARTGAEARRFSEIPTSMQRPIEVCGVGAENAWLQS